MGRAVGSGGTLDGLAVQPGMARFATGVVDACVALASEYNAIAIAIRSEFRTLLRDLPQLLDATLSDETPAANSQTQAWLRELVAEPARTRLSPMLPPRL